MAAAHIQIPEDRIRELCQRNGIRRLSLSGSVLTGSFSGSKELGAAI
jgi:hypothetical protein